MILKLSKVKVKEAVDQFVKNNCSNKISEIKNVTKELCVKNKTYSTENRDKNIKSCENVILEYSDY